MMTMVMIRLWRSCRTLPLMEDWSGNIKATNCIRNTMVERILNLQPIHCFFLGIGKNLHQVIKGKGKQKKIIRKLLQDKKDISWLSVHKHSPKICMVYVWLPLHKILRIIRFSREIWTEISLDQFSLDWNFSAPIFSGLKFFWIKVEGP